MRFQKVLATTALIGSASAFHSEEGTFEYTNDDDETIDVDIIEVYNDSDMEFDKVLVYMHGMREKNSWPAERLLEDGYWGSDIEDLKVIFPQSIREEHVSEIPSQVVYDYYYDGEYAGLWINAEEGALENACLDQELGWFKTCTWVIEEMQESGAVIAAIIQNEIDNNGISASNIFLAGYSQGGTMVYQTAFNQLDFAIGGYFAIGAIPIYPILTDYVEGEDISTLADFSYYGSDMNWFTFAGEDDDVYPVLDGNDEVQAVFEEMGDDAPNYAYEGLAEGVEHFDDCRFFGVMLDFVLDGEVTSISDHDECADPSDEEEEEEEESEPAFLEQYGLYLGGVFVVTLAAYLFLM